MTNIKSNEVPKELDRQTELILLMCKLEEAKRSIKTEGTVKSNDLEKELEVIH